MQRIVHIDLKGAPLKITYFERFLTLLKSWGATGVLIEWEDSFPYQLDDIKIHNQDDLYSIGEVRHIIQYANAIGLEVVQLVQTIGHMEFVLKHPKYAGLRELSTSPAVLCPSKINSQLLVRCMLDQILEVQPGAKYLHIGADEVWHSAICPVCKEKTLDSQYKPGSLYLNHIRNITLYLKERRPELVVLMWDDMLRNIDLEVLKLYELGNLVEPVVWDYSPVDAFQISPFLWEKYHTLFNKVWAASAYKGANGSCQLASPVLRYASNQVAWAREVRKYQSDVNFVGVIITGWSRYDHYATLCELLPVSLPSLANCLKIWEKNCHEDVIMLSEALPLEEWPGHKLAKGIHSFVLLREKCQMFIHGDLVLSWMNQWQLKSNFTNPLQVERVTLTAQQLTTELSELKVDLAKELLNFTGNRTANEWINTFITPILQKLIDLRDESQARCVAGPSVMPVA